MVSLQRSCLHMGFQHSACLMRLSQPKNKHVHLRSPSGVNPKYRPQQASLAPHAQSVLSIKLR